MTKEIERARGKLLKVAAELVTGFNLPSPYVEDHEQKTYSAGRIAKLAEEWRECCKVMGVNVREGLDALIRRVKDLEAGRIKDLEATRPVYDREAAGRALFRARFPFHEWSSLPPASRGSWMRLADDAIKPLFEKGVE